MTSQNFDTDFVKDMDDEFMLEIIQQKLAKRQLTVPERLSGFDTAEAVFQCRKSQGEGETSRFETQEIDEGLLDGHKISGPEGERPREKQPILALAGAQIKET